MTTSSKDAAKTPKLGFPGACAICKILRSHKRGFPNTFTVLYALQLRREQVQE